MPNSGRKLLSVQDQAVLDSIFNPLQISGDTPITYDDVISEELQDPLEEQTPDIKQSCKLEIEAVKLAENGDFHGSLTLFESAVKLTPNRPSLYNNRAQLYRLKGLDDDALVDLNKALELSPNISRTRCQALCQRGILFRKQNNLDAAREDFESAAKLGSKFARTQLVEINPYAALCNQMLRDAFQKLC